MRKNLRGWQSVFAFTFRQATQGKAFRIVTTLVSLIIIGVFILINVLIAKLEDSDEIIDPSPIDTVYILDNSGLEATDYKELYPEFSQDYLNHIELISIKDKSEAEVVKLAESNSPNSIAIIISATNGTYHIEARIPNESDIIDADAWEIVDIISKTFETNKILESGLSMEQLQAISAPVNSTYHDIGENTNPAAFAIKFAAPMLFSFMLYMMFILYGQTVSKAVAEEKTSKLIETLLISVRPYGLIAGKVLSTTCVALMQFSTWILAAIIGLYGGNYIAQHFYPESQNIVITIINFIRDNIGETGMTPTAIIMALIMFCVGFLFYCTIAGLSGSFASRQEDITQSQALFQLPIVFSWLISYFAPSINNENLTSTLRYIPFTAPFSVPVDLITGTIGLAEGLISLIIMSMTTALVIILSARVYKGLVLYTGQKISFKTVINILKSNN